MSYSDDADSMCPGGCMVKDGCYILGYCICIAAGTGCPRDAVLFAVSGINMVIADGGCCDKLHLRTGQQIPVDNCAGTDDECIRITHSRSGDGFRLQTDDIGIRCQLFVRQRHIFVHNDFHH